MSIQFNADEIFEIAIQIEKNGYIFYNECSKKVGNQEIKDLLKMLAEAEEKHEAIFETMQKKFRDSDSFIAFDDADDIRLHYLQAVASGYVFDLNASPVDKISPDIKIDEILKFALDREKDAVVFFVSMKEMVKDEKEKDNIQKIISEEIEHVIFITQQIDRYCKN